MRSCWNEQAMRRFQKNTLVMNAVPRDNWLHFSGNSWLHGQSWLTHHWLDLASETHTAAVVKQNKRLLTHFSQELISELFPKTAFPVETAEERHFDYKVARFPALSHKEAQTVRLFLRLRCGSFQKVSDICTGDIPLRRIIGKDRYDNIFQMAGSQSHQGVVILISPEEKQQQQQQILSLQRRDFHPEWYAKKIKLCLLWQTLWLSHDLRQFLHHDVILQESKHVPWCLEKNYCWWWNRRSCILGQFTSLKKRHRLPVG